MSTLSIDALQVDPEQGLTANWHEHRLQEGGERVAGVIIFPIDEWPPDIHAAVSVLNEAVHKAVMNRLAAVVKEAVVGE